MLIVQPIGGLANRIRVLAFAKHIAEECHTELVCRWTVNEELRAPFESIFKRVDFPVVNVDNRHYLLRKRRRWWRNIAAKVWMKVHNVDVWFPSECVNIALKHDTDEERCLFYANIKRELRNGKNVYVATGNNLGKFDISFLVPVDELMEKVAHCASHFRAGHSCGLHIRRTDNTWAIMHSPIELFEEKIEEIISKDRSVMFYLATDDVKTAQYLCAKYTHNIVYREKELNRNSENGIREAVVDMWILGRMDIIYGSYWSSFSEISSWINNIPICYISNGK